MGMVLEMREWEGRRNLFRHPRNSMKKVERLVWFRSDKFLESDLVPRQWEESKDSERDRGLAILAKLNVELEQGLQNRCSLLIEVQGVMPFCEWVSSSI